MRFLGSLGALALPVLLVATTWAGGPPAAARPDCPIADPDSSILTVTFEIPGRDVVTIVPDGRSETLAANGISIVAVVKYLSGVPAAGIPSQEMVLFNPGLCLCPGGNIADAPTDITGRTTFRGMLQGGGSCESLQMYVDGVLLGSFPIRVNSPDLNADCAVDGGDICAFAPRLGTRVGNPGYTFAADFNEDGAVDAGDLSRLASSLGARCGF